MGKEGYTVSSIYSGGYSTFEPSPQSYYFQTGKFSLPTDPRTANIVESVSARLSSGVKNVEVEGVSPEIFDSIPKQQLKEVNRLAKLTGSQISMHGPVINVSGIDTRSGAYSEAERENAERKVAETLERSHELDPEGNIPVNFHSAEGIPGSQMLPPSEREMAVNEYGREYEKKHKMLLAVEQETGRIVPLPEEEKFYPGGREGVKHEIYSPEKTLQILNDTDWSNTLAKIEFNREHAERIMRDIHPIFREKYIYLRTGKLNPNTLSQEEMEQIKRVYSADEYIKQASMSLNAAFNKAYKYGNEQEKKLLQKYSDEYGKHLGINATKEEDKLRGFDPKTRSDAMHALMSVLGNVNPESYMPLEEFTVEKSAQTFGNAAFEAYKKLKKKGEPTPILTIENPPAGFALSTGEDIKKVVEASRKQFVKKAVDEGMSETQAKEEASKIIGATLDVGHMNMLRKYGYTEKDIIKESEKMAPFLKHLHLSDNFGFEHTELPMGMGNVPTKEIMQKIEGKIGKKKTDELRKVIEASGWWQHFSKQGAIPPFQPTLEGLGAPIYSTAGPYWSQAGFYHNYYGGFGQMLPQINYETFGGGFSQLPAELGGQRPGAGGRMSGKPME